MSRPKGQCSTREGGGKRLYQRKKWRDASCESHNQLRDGWIHHLELLDRKETPYKTELLPLVVPGQNACPLEDCRGPYGYRDLRNVLRNPQHKEYTEMRQWMVRIGKANFDPQKYSVDEVNKKLRNLNDHIWEFEANMESAS
jgi:hypothetical protein